MDNPYRVGDRVLASRGQDGANHEEGTVVDSYSLIIGEETRPMVCVEFGDGTRAYLNASGPDVRPLEEPETEPAAGGSGEQGG